MGRIAVRALAVRALAAVAVVASMTVGAVAPAHAGQVARSVADATAAGAPLSGEARAIAQARSTGRPVTVSGDTTATDTVTANPAGTLTLTRSLVPVRKWMNGAWRPLDAALHRAADGSVSTAVTTGGLTLSGGGTGALMTLRALGKVLAVSFPVPLPVPAISGSTATYADVLRGVDLQVTANAQGSASEVLIVRDAAAAANPALRQLVLGVQAPGLRLTTGTAGDITLSNPGGHVIFAAPTPVMWDSAPPAAGTPVAVSPSGEKVDARTGTPLESSATSPGAGARVMPVGVAVQGSAIVLSPDQSMLTSPSTRFPMYIDPSFTAPSAGSSANEWNTVNTGFPTTSNWKTTSMDLQVGDQGWESPFFVARSFVSMPVPSKIYGSTIISAQLNLVEDWAPSCTATPVQAWLTGGISSSTTWDNQPSWSAEQSSQTVAHGYTPCGSKPAGVGFGVAGALQSAANSKWTQVAFGLRAGDESDPYGWKKFSDAAGSITMSVTYDHAPAMPSGLGTSPATVCGASTPTVVGDSDVQLFVPVLDPDGGTVGVTLQLWNTATGAAFTGTPTNPQNLFVSSGSTAVFVAHKADLEAAAGGAVTEFSWKAQATDYDKTSGWSVTCNFEFDASRPGAPTVTLPSAPATIGQPASVTVTPPAGPVPARYVYQLNAGPPQTVTADSAGNATIAIVPTRFANQVTVIALSAAGNYGVPAVSPVFTAAEGAPAADADLTGDGRADLLTVGGGMPAGLWLAAGNGDGTVSTQASDWGVHGNGTAGDGSPADFTGAQAVTGHFNGTQFQDVLAYYPGGANPGSADILFGTGDGSASDPVSGGEQTISAGTFTDFNADNPVQLANGGDTQGAGYPWPDLIGINGDPADGYYLDFFPDSDAVGGYQNSVPLTTLTPSGGSDWNDWQIATAQVASGTAMYLWDSSTGALYLWEGLSYNSATGALAYTQYAIADGSASHWRQGAQVTVHAADINDDGVPDLWTATGSGVVTAYLATLGSGTASLAAGPAQTLLSASHTWPLTDGTSGSVATTADTSGSPALALTGSANASWNTGDMFSPDVALDGSGDRLATASAAVNPNSGGFTVSAWADPAALGGTVLSQDMTKTASFRLYATASGTWSFCLATSDTAPPGYDCATGGTAQPGVWSQLTATYDPSTTAINLYQGTVNIGHASHAALSGITNGAFQVGDYLNGTARTGYFNGQVSGVQAWSRVIPPAEVASPGGYFHPLTPTRILDTRSSSPLAGGGTLNVPVTGTAGIPATGVLAVAVNIAAVQPTADGTLSVYPDDTPAPAVSDLNFSAGVTLANFKIVAPGPDGKISIHDAGGGSTNVLVDASGYFTADPAAVGAATFTPVTPIRILDTVHGTGAPKARISAGSTLALQVAGTGGVPSGATAVALVFHGLNTSTDGYLQYFPDGAARPNASGLQIHPGMTIDGTDIVPVAADGKIDILAEATTDLVADVEGYFTAGTSGEKFHAIGGTRLIDTRQHGGPLASGGILPVSAATEVTALNPALVVNFTVEGGSAAGWLAAYAQGATRGTGSNVDYAASSVIDGLAVTPSGAGTLDVYNNGGGGTTQVEVDCSGYFSIG